MIDEKAIDLLSSCGKTKMWFVSDCSAWLAKDITETWRAQGYICLNLSKSTICIPI
jgi:hypothetical protein